MERQQQFEEETRRKIQRLEEELLRAQAERKEDKEKGRKEKEAEELRIALNQKS